MTAQICHVSGKIFIRKLWSRIYFPSEKTNWADFTKVNNALSFLQQLKRGKKKSLNVAHFIHIHYWDVQKGIQFL